MFFLDTHKPFLVRVSSIRVCKCNVNEESCDAGKPNRTYIQSDSKGKLESNATQPVVNERKKPHHRRPKQGQQNHSTEARKREVFTVETGLSRRGGGGGKRQRGRQEYGGRRRERGEEREKEREGKEDREKKGREGEDREKQDREEAEREKKDREKKGREGEDREEAEREKKGREKNGREGETREEAEREKKGREKKGREGEDREKQDREEAEREEKGREKEDRERREDGEELKREKKDRERKDGERERGKGRRYEENNPRKRVVQKVDGECGVPHEDYVSTKTVGEEGRGSGRLGKRRGKRAKDESRHTKNEEGEGVVGKTAKGGERDVYDSEKMDSHNVSQKSQPKTNKFRERRTDGNWRSEGGDNEKVIGSEKKRYMYDDTLLERGEGRKERYMYDDTLLERGEGRKERLEKEGERRAHRRSGHSATHKRGKGIYNPCVYIIVLPPPISLYLSISHPHNTHSLSHSM